MTFANSTLIVSAVAQNSFFWHQKLIADEQNFTLVPVQNPAKVHFWEFHWWKHFHINLKTHAWQTSWIEHNRDYANTTLETNKHAIE